MTTKRDKKDEPKKARPKLKKETLRDLSVKGGKVRGGVARVSANCGETEPGATAAPCPTPR